MNLSLFLTFTLYFLAQEALSLYGWSCLSFKGGGGGG